MMFNRALGSILAVVLVISVGCHAQLTDEKLRVLSTQYNSEAVEYCHPPCQTDISLQDRVASIKLARYYNLADVHMQNVARFQKVARPLLEEGHTMGAPHKVRTLSRLADDPRVKNICEIGFNAGHSSLNFLVSNADANLVVFDIFVHNYTSLAVRSLKTMFPERSIIAVAGSSEDSVPDFTSVVDRTFKCQLMFIDGEHSPRMLEKDLSNFQILADPNFNIVIIDDLQLPEMDQLYENWKLDGRLKELENYDNIRSSWCMNWDVSSDGTYFEFDPGEGDCLTRLPGVEKIAVASFLNS